MGYLKKQSRDVASFRRDESILIPDSIDYDSFSGLSNEVKTKLKEIRPKTLGQAIRIDGVSSCHINPFRYIKKGRFKVSA